MASCSVAFLKGVAHSVWVGTDIAESDMPWEEKKAALKVEIVRRARCSLPAALRVAKMWRGKDPQLMASGQVTDPDLMLGSFPGVPRARGANGKYVERPMEMVAKVEKLNLSGVDNFARRALEKTMKTGKVEAIVGSGFTLRTLWLKSGVGWIRMVEI